jgi:hypothetical protein
VRKFHCRKRWAHPSPDEHGTDLQVRLSLPARSPILRPDTNTFVLVSKANATYLRVICHRKHLCGEKILSGRMSIDITKAHSKIEMGYLNEERLGCGYLLLTKTYCGRRSKLSSTSHISRWTKL